MTLLEHRQKVSAAPTRAGATRVRLGANAVVVLVAVVGAAGLGLALGGRPLGLSSVLDALRGRDAGDASIIVLDQRLPRTLLGLIVGAALGVGGAVAQSLTRNPLADPGLLGVSAGAALSIVCGSFLFGVTTLAPQLLLAIVGASVAGAWCCCWAAVPPWVGPHRAWRSSVSRCQRCSGRSPRPSCCSTHRRWMSTGSGSSAHSPAAASRPSRPSRGPLAVGAALSWLSTRSQGRGGAGGVQAACEGGRGRDKRRSRRPHHLHRPVPGRADPPDGEQLVHRTHPGRRRAGATRCAGRGRVLRGDRRGADPPGRRRLHLRPVLSGGQPTKERFLRNPLWKELEGVKTGHVTDVADEIWRTSVSVQGAHLVLDDLAETFDVDAARS